MEIVQQVLFILLSGVAVFLFAKKVKEIIDNIRLGRAETISDNKKQLEKIAMQQRTVYMCSEAVWWRCHRSMVSDFLKVQGWEVMHIMGIGKEVEHPFTAPAAVVAGVLTYGENKIESELF